MTSLDLRLSDISRCFQGVIPSIIATSDRDGIPNITYVSQIYLMDETHVALSRQFFNKTSRNLDQTGRAFAEMYDPVTFQAYRLKLKFLRSEKSGPLFQKMSMRIDAIAAMTGMAGIFKLIGADVFEVERAECVDGFLEGGADEQAWGGASLEGLRTEVRGIQYVSDRINRAEDLESLLEGVLAALEEFFGFSHTMVLLNDETCGKLVTIASHGYGESGVGAEVLFGEGIIGTVARERSVLRMTGLNAGLRYSRAVRRQMKLSDGTSADEIPLPGLPDAQSALVIPLNLGERLVGVLASESRDPVKFGDWHEAYLEIIGNQIALGIDRMAERASVEPVDSEPAQVPVRASINGASPAARRRVLHYYRSDDCIFIDGEYLIRNVPARILWKLLREWETEGRTEFTNRELRLDPSLGLPAVKDNLESRLILLRHRLQEKSADIRVVPTGRGKFSLVVDSRLDLVEK